ncbi:glutathione S-transferase [Microvirga vignae]|uniref:Glutathione S-transferase n=1 Tax=Microvirga vignae TaxID=1225564 RepID=A0A0H1RBA6_9HYPH|nr:glutathione S-transferase family protein [Microvirga vignae]KLK92314.1 glutathione S-transferase [Microvirga vignae]
MADNLIFYTHPQSRGRIVRWMLEEVGHPYKTEILQFGTSIKSPDYLAFNPMGKVPTIIHDGTVVTEAAAICAYLADVFPEAGLAPPHGDRRRGPYYRWMFFAAGPVEAALSNKAFGFEVPTERRSVIGYGSVEDVVNALEYAVTQSEYIAGDRFSAADVYVGSQIGWGMMFGTLEKRRAFEAYWKRISSRPAAIRAREIDDALVAAQQQASQ